MKWIADTLKLPIQDVKDYGGAIGSKNQNNNSEVQIFLGSCLFVDFNFSNSTARLNTQFQNRVQREKIRSEKGRPPIEQPFDTTVKRFIVLKEKICDNLCAYYKEKNWPLGYVVQLHSQTLSSYGSHAIGGRM